MFVASFEITEHGSALCPNQFTTSLNNQHSYYIAKSSYVKKAVLWQNFWQPRDIFLLSVN